MSEPDATGLPAAISVAEVGGSALIVVSGNPSVGQVAVLAAMMRRIQARGADILLELSALEVCSSPMLEALVRCRRRAGDDGPAFTVAASPDRAPRHLCRLLRLVGLTADPLLPG